MPNVKLGAVEMSEALASRILDAACRAAQGGDPKKIEYALNTYIAFVNGGILVGVPFEDQQGIIEGSSHVAAQERDVPDAIDAAVRALHHYQQNDQAFLALSPAIRRTIYVAAGRAVGSASADTAGKRNIKTLIGQAMNLLIKTTHPT